MEGGRLLAHGIRGTGRASSPCSIAVSRTAGLQEYTTFLSGTSANPNVSWQTAALLGLIHLLLYVAFILLVPISLITAGLLAAWNRWKGRPRNAEHA